VLIWVAVLYFMDQAKKGKGRNLRRLPAIDAIEEAVGRATEMGKTVTFEMGVGEGGLASSRASAHMAAIDLIGYVSQITARNNVPLVVSVSWAELIPMVEAKINESYLMENQAQPDLGKMVRFYGSDQVTFAMGAMGTIYAEKPGANFIMGWVYDIESLVITAAAADVGAIQVGGSADYYSTGYMLVNTDYALMPEEVICAGAYVSNDAVIIGGIAGQDIAKIILIGISLLGSILALLGSNIIYDLTKL